MLIEFKVSNYRSICEEQILSLVPSESLKDFPENIISKKKFKALNSIAIYGANSSGKSNLLNAIEILDKLLFLSTKSSSKSKLSFDPFLLKSNKYLSPTELEITFVTKNIRYRYGVKFNNEKILEEWLYRKKVGREVVLFYRENDIIDVSSGFEGNPKLIDTAIDATRDNALFLSFCDMLNVSEAKAIFEWFNELIVVNGLDTEREELRTITLWEDKELQENIKEYLSLLDLGFLDVSIKKKEFDPTELPSELSDSLRQSLIQKLSGQMGIQVNTVHSLYDENGNKLNDVITWLMQERESAGTQKAFSLSGPILRALSQGGIIIIDEIEAKIHPIITLNIINLFLSKDTNPNNAQIIFATHDTNLLSHCNLRRDQINFIEKNPWEASELYSLSDMKFKENAVERIDSDKEKRYLEGRYGGIPILGTFKEKIQKWYGKKG